MFVEKRTALAEGLHAASSFEGDNMNILGSRMHMDNFYMHDRSISMILLTRICYYIVSRCFVSICSITGNNRSVLRMMVSRSAASHGSNKGKLY